MLAVLYAHCQRCKRRLREPVAHTPEHCRSCARLSSVELPMELPRVPSDAPAPPPAPRRRPRPFTDDDFSDMDRRGEIFDEAGIIRWRSL